MVARSELRKRQLALASSVELAPGMRVRIASQLTELELLAERVRPSVRPTGLMTDLCANVRAAPPIASRNRPVGNEGNIPDDEHAELSQNRFCGPSVFLFVLALGACTGDIGVPDDIEPTVTATDSDSGGPGATGGPSPTGGPEPGGDPQVVEGRCLFDDDDAIANNLYGYRYQCTGILAATVDFDNDQTEIGVVFGPLVEGDSYAEPKVMACCPTVKSGPPPCEQPHVQACVVDALEQSCKSIPVRLEEHAQDLLPASKEAALKTAKYIVEHQQDCYNAFAQDSGVASTKHGCDADLSADPNFPELAIGASWSFNPPGVVQNVTIQITTAEINGIFPWTTDPEHPGEQCLSADFNDHVVFSKLPPGLGASDFVSLYHGQVEARSTDLLESARLVSIRTGCSAESCSRLRIVEGQGGEATLVHLLAKRDVPVTVSGITVDAFRAELVGPAVGVEVFGSPGVYEIARESAVFAISGKALGGSALVGVKNTSTIRFRRGPTSGSWDLDPFQLSYTDSTDEVFDFFLGATRWQ